jgi:hypothetical protein
MDINKLILAKNSFFKDANNLNRKRENVYLRAAFANAFRPISRVIDLGAVLHRDHSSIIYYCKTHESNIKYDDYKKIYDKALDIKNKFLEENQELNIDLLLSSIKELKEKIKLQEKTIEDLTTYKVKYENIIKVL